MRTGQVVVRHDVDHGEADYLPWRTFNERLGHHSAIALPLIHATQCFGALSIPYSTQARVFDAAEVRLLEDPHAAAFRRFLGARGSGAAARRTAPFMFERAIESASTAS